MGDVVMDEFKDYVYQNYFLDGYGVIHILELDELSKKFNLDIKKVKQELKKLKCKIYKPMKKGGADVLLDLNI